MPLMKKEGVPLLDAHPALLRPANYPAGNPGRGWCVAETAAGLPVAVLNLQGQAFMAPIENPFRSADAVLGNDRFCKKYIKEYRKNSEK